MNSKLFFLCIAALVSIVACTKDPKIEEVFFAFEMPFTITPGTNTVRVGDTLRMEADFSDTLYDLISGKKIHLPEFSGFNIFIISNKITDSSKSFFSQSGAGASLFFQSFNTTQFQQISEKYSLINLFHANNSYHFYVEIIPKEKGVYSIMIGNGGGGVENKGFIELPSYVIASEPGIRRIPVVRQNRYIINEGRTNKSLFRKFAQPLQSSDSSIQFQSTFTFEAF